MSRKMANAATGKTARGVGKIKLLYKLLFPSPLKTSEWNWKTARVNSSCLLKKKRVCKNII
jgi:hypothetical protein